MAHHTDNIRSAYLSNIYIVENRKIIINYAVRELRKLQQYFDSIVVRGTSGLLIGPEVSSRLKKPLGVVRKKTDKSHYSAGYEGTVDIGRYIIIDDFIASGDTIRHIVKEMELSVPGSKCVGVYGYWPNRSESSPRNVRLGNFMESEKEFSFKQESVHLLGPYYTNKAWLNGDFAFQENGSKKYGVYITMKGAEEKIKELQ